MTGFELLSGTTGTGIISLHLLQLLLEGCGGCAALREYRGPSCRLGEERRIRFLEPVIFLQILIQSRIARLLPVRVVRQHLHVCLPRELLHERQWRVSFFLLLLLLI